MRLRSHLLPVLGLTLSASLTLASLYQLEIILIWVSQDKWTFEFPFCIWLTSVWIARDLWYAVMLVGWAVGLISAFFLGSRRGMRMHR